MSYVGKFWKWSFLVTKKLRIPRKSFVSPTHQTWLLLKSLGQSEVPKFDKIKSLDATRSTWSFRIFWPRKLWESSAFPQRHLHQNVVLHTLRMYLNNMFPSESEVTVLDISRSRHRMSSVPICRWIEQGKQSFRETFSSTFSLGEKYSYFGQDCTSPKRSVKAWFTLACFRCSDNAQKCPLTLVSERYEVWGWISPSTKNRTV